jgi:cyclase
MSASAPLVTRVGERALAYLQPDGGWCLNNAGIVVGAREVLLVDTAATRSRAEALRDAVATVTSLPVRTVVNTHHHGDHTYGNCVFTPGATVVSHDRAREEMAEKGLGMRAVWPAVDWGDIRLDLPSVTFSERLTIHLDDLRVKVFHVGPAHTTGDAVVWLPEQRVLFAGDLVLSGCTPFLLMGSVRGTREAVATLRGLEPEVVVCGHGPVSGPEVFDTTDSYLDWLATAAQDGMARGRTPLEQARRLDLGEFGTLLDPERVVANLHRAYAEADGAVPGARLPSAPVIAEMVAYNGGRPLRCLA